MTSTRKKLITDFLPTVKKSQRIIEKQKALEGEELKRRCICKSIDPPGFVIRHFTEKGLGVVSTKEIKKGDFVCEYSGDLISTKEAKKRERQYEKEKAGSYMYYFEWKNVKYCLDATYDPTGKSLGRLINHSRKQPNCKTSVFENGGKPHLIFIALKDIRPGQELLYDYGETEKATIEANPWLVDS